MKKQAIQKLHHTWMQTKMHSLFNSLGLNYHDFGTARNKGYWFKFDKVTAEQKEYILASHPKPEIIRFLGSYKEYAPEIRNCVLFLPY